MYSSVFIVDYIKCMPQCVYTLHCQLYKGAIAVMYYHIHTFFYVHCYLKLCLCHQANNSKDRKRDC